jgi:hypothetical protein
MDRYSELETVCFRIERHWGFVSDGDATEAWLTTFQALSRDKRVFICWTYDFVLISEHKMSEI